MPRHAAVRVDLDAVADNVSALAALADPAALCVVVKADGYGHGAVAVAAAALGSGATSLAVATVEEGVELRSAGITAPVLVLSEQPADSLRDAWKHGITPTLYHHDAVEAAGSLVRKGSRWGVQVKVDTGMHRVGAAPSAARDLAAAVLAHQRLVLDGVFTHLAVADEPGRPETQRQLEMFSEVVTSMRDAGVDPGTLHAANSAGTLGHPAARLDMVRCGLAAYGLAPSAELEGIVPLRPAMSVTAEVSHTAQMRAGDGVSYGLRYTFDRDATVAVVPVGYADGVRRALWDSGASVLIGGRRCPIRGVVTMDQLVVEVTDGPEVCRGDEVVLLGAQAGPAGSDEITAGEWAERLGTITWEVVTGFGPRLPRLYSGDAASMVPNGSRAGGPGDHRKKDSRTEDARTEDARTEDDSGGVRSG